MEHMQMTSCTTPLPCDPLYKIAISMIRAYDLYPLFNMIYANPGYSVVKTTWMAKGNECLRGVPSRLRYEP
jgi:hypothetical protein